MNEFWLEDDSDSEFPDTLSESDMNSLNIFLNYDETKFLEVMKKLKERKKMAPKEIVRLSDIKEESEENDADEESCFSDISDQFKVIHTFETHPNYSSNSENNAKVLDTYCNFLAGLQNDYFFPEPNKIRDDSFRFEDINETKESMSFDGQNSSPVLCLSPILQRSENRVLEMAEIYDTVFPSPGRTPIRQRQIYFNLLNEQPPASYLEARSDGSVENSRSQHGFINVNYLSDPVKEKRLEELSSPTFYKKSVPEESKFDASSERTVNNQISLDDDISPVELEESDLDMLDFNPSAYDRAFRSVDSENDTFTSNLRRLDSELSMALKYSGENADKTEIRSRSPSKAKNKTFSNIPVPTPKK
ncbi:hypothetical protein HK096_006691, partial [Nowakowskiella sp. JEL0078]